MEIKRKGNTIDIIDLDFDDYINLICHLELRECDLKSELNIFKNNEYSNILIPVQEVKINEVKDLIEKLKG